MSQNVHKIIRDVILLDAQEQDFTLEIDEANYVSLHEKLAAERYNQRALNSFTRNGGFSYGRVTTD